MDALLAQVLSISTLVFAVSSMLSVGLRHTMQEIVAPLRNARLVIGAVIANFVLVPVLAYAITAVFSFGEAREIGLIVVACAAGAPFLVKLAQIAGADLAIATGILVLLLAITILYMPIVVPLIAPEADVSAAAIARPLALTMLLPLVAGLIARPLILAWTDRLLPLLGIVANVTLVALLASTVVVYFEEILSVFGTGAILAAILFIAGAFVIGYLLGITGRGTREELALGTAQRNIAAATVVATQSLGDPDTIVMVVVTSMVAMAILFPTAAALRRRTEREPIAAHPAGTSSPTG